MNHLVQTGKNFMEYTSLHGLARIADAKYWLKKLVWCALFLGSLGMCLYQVTRLFQQFTNFQVNTKIELKNEPQEFPGVAICNINPAKYERIVHTPQLFRIIRSLSLTTGIGLEEFSLGPLSVNESLYDNYSYEIDDLEYAIQTFQLEMASMSDDLLQEISQTSAEFLHYCLLNREDCKESIITPYRDPNFGICFKLESKDIVFSPGESYGLKIYLHIDQRNYLPFIAQSEGVKVHIYNTKYSPNVASEGISLPAGFEVKIGITKKIHNRLPGPDGTCDVQNSYASVMSCIATCIDVEVLRLCKCAKSYVEKEEEENIHYCTSDDDVKCVLHVLGYIETDIDCPYCKSPCNEIKYENVISMTRWPSSNFEPYILWFENISTQDTSKNLMVLRVFYNSLQTESITEEIAYTTENFVSDIGGQLGLWIGMSVLSMAEVFELILLIIYACARKTRTEDNQAAMVNQRKRHPNNITVTDIE